MASQHGTRDSDIGAGRSLRRNGYSHPVQDTYVLVLAGGRGTRLHQLTSQRAKPAVPFAGKLNIIDFTLSNCINSGIRRIGVHTLYMAQSLVRHIEGGWGFLEDNLGEFVARSPREPWVCLCLHSSHRPTKQLSRDR